MNYASDILIAYAKDRKTISKNKQEVKILYFSDSDSDIDYNIDTDISKYIVHNV